jgi:hypothetical protein
VQNQCDHSALIDARGREESLIDQVDDHLVRWVETTLGPLTISLQSPEKMPEGQGVSLYLLSLAEKPPLQGAHRVPLQFWLRYLVTAWSEEPSEAHALLGDLLLAAMDTPEYEIELDTIPPTLWTAFGIPPRPAFILRVPVRKERPQRPVQLVRQPLNVKWIKPVRVQGAIYGPEDCPLPGVRVALMPGAGSHSLAREYARLCPFTVTDAQGQFIFDSVPDQPRCTLFIQVKDQELFATLESPLFERKSWVLRWDLLALQVFVQDGHPPVGSLVRFHLKSSPEPELHLVCAAEREPLRGLHLEYPALQLATVLNAQGQGYLLLQEKALGQAGQWLPDLTGQLLSPEQLPLAGVQIVSPSLNLSAFTDDQGLFKLKRTT